MQDQYPQESPPTGQQAPGGIPPEYSAPPMGGETQGMDPASGIARELDPRTYLRDLLQYFRGKVWDERRGQYVEEEDITPLLNKKGRNKFFHFASPFLTRVVTMSNFRTDEQKIYDLVRMQVNTASRHFHLHWKEYDIQNREDIEIITNHLTIVALAACFKALGAGDRKAATSNIQESITREERPAPQQQSSGGGGLGGGIASMFGGRRNR